MSRDEQTPVISNDDDGVKGRLATEEEKEYAVKRTIRSIRARELYCSGSRNFLLKNYIDAADELSAACAAYEDIYGELSDELGMPYLLYAKTLIALALDENKVVDVPDEEDLDDDDDDDGSSANGIKEENEEILPDSTTDEADTLTSVKKELGKPVLDDEKPSTSNGDCEEGEVVEDIENDPASSLQLAWEILELADKIFSRQGADGLSNLAEVRTELANIQFENNLPVAARGDYVKALKIYQELPPKYRRAMAEIHYKIGLTYLMQRLNKASAESLKAACELIDDEIKEMQESNEELNEKRKSKIQDLEETKQEIWEKISEIEEMQAQTIANVRAALDNYIVPIDSPPADTNGAGNSNPASSPSAAGASSSSAAKPTDISHLIKRKKPSNNVDTEVAPSPSKRPAV